MQWKKILLGERWQEDYCLEKWKLSLKTRVYVYLTRTKVLGLKVMSVKSVIGQVYEKCLLN